LKVIHYYLDKPKISCILISNVILDAAKTNRALMLHQPSTSYEDLERLAKGCLDLKNNSKKQQKIIVALINSYLGLGTDEFEKYSNIPKDFFQLRDFIYFLRSLRRKVDLTPENIYHSLQRNFNGVSKECFLKLIELFFKNLNESLKEPFEIPKNIKPYLSILKESIDDYLEKGEDPNLSPFRYILLIDPSETQNSIDILMNENIINPKNIEFCSVSDFVEDNNEFSKSKVITKVKYSMEVGKTVILINSGSINTNFYDVLNKHFSHIKNSDNNEVHYFANVNF
jgi:E3 ubiquitin-protein ligase RNF213